jgi:hypothetical protein
MNIEFHYYIIYFLSLKAGFNDDDAYTIAYSSQFVDSNILIYHIETDKEIYITQPTQNYGWWDKSFPNLVYLPFHFFPGDNNQADCNIRKDGRINPLNCTANSTNVKKLLIAALQTRNLYRVGIGLHTFADSFAHQNFSGILEDWNVIVDNSIVPSIGHAQALQKPDFFHLTWEDPRLAEPLNYIDNKQRYYEAAKKIYKYLCLYNQHSYNDIDLVLDELMHFLNTNIVAKGMNERILDFIIEYSIPKFNRTEWLSQAITLKEDSMDDELFKGYDKLLWLRDATLFRSSLFKREAVKAKPHFYNSHFYHWQEAARAHLLTATQLLKTLSLVKG